MAVIRLLKNAKHYSEFQNDPLTGHHYTGDCGECGLSTARVASETGDLTTQQAIDLMTWLNRDMMSRGWADAPQAITTTHHLHQEALAQGWRVDEAHTVEWQDPIPAATLHPWMLELAGVKPFVLMITNAGPGLTAVDGSHPERGVAGHFICVVGLADEGYICNDGDNYEIGLQLVTYPWSAIQAAHVTGILTLEMETGVGIPTGWTDDGTTMTASNGVQVGSYFRTYVLSQQWSANNLPLRPARLGVVLPGTPGLGEVAVQDFLFSSLGYTNHNYSDANFSVTAEHVFVVPTGRDIVTLLQDKADLEAKLAQPAPTPAPVEVVPADLQAALHTLSGYIK